MAKPDKSQAEVVESAQNSENQVVDMKQQDAKKQAKLDAKKAKLEQKEKAKKAQQNAKAPKQNKVKETVSELKKVTWPTFGMVVKRTLLVLAIVILFTVVLFAIDRVLSWLYQLMVSGTVTNWF